MIYKMIINANGKKIESYADSIINLERNFQQIVSLLIDETLDDYESKKVG